MWEQRSLRPFEQDFTSALLLWITADNDAGSRDDEHGLLSKNFLNRGIVGLVVYTCLWLWWEAEMTLPLVLTFV